VLSVSVWSFQIKKCADGTWKTKPPENLGASEIVRKEIITLKVGSGLSHHGVTGPLRWSWVKL
jgi:hypothetical protein